MNPRKHQSESEQIFAAMARGEVPNRVVLDVTPGAGKSTIPIIAGQKLIYSGQADKLCWVVPRNALRDQGERVFMHHGFRAMFNHGLNIRSATNDPDPCRGEDGFITTYQALGHDRGALADEFARRRYILVLDEFHHVEVDSKWERAIAPLVERASHLVLMTGTLERGNGKKIGFVPYRPVGDGFVPDPTNGASLVRYTRADALAERAILPIMFHLSDGDARWLDIDGVEQQARLSTALRQDIGAAVFTALSTDFSTQLLDTGLAHWLEYRKTHLRSKLLVVTAGIEGAKKHAAHLKRIGVNCKIATSHETQAAHRAILEFKAGRIDALVTIAMAYEGLDVPEITHIVSLTHIRSAPWIEQMVARGVRIDPLAGPYEGQICYVFGPADNLFRQVVDRIEAEQTVFVRKPREQEQTKTAGKTGDQLGLFQGNIYGIQPLDSSLNGRQIVVAAAGGADIPIPPPAPMTRTEIENDLRAQIKDHVHRFAHANYYQPDRINAEIKRAFGGKSRSHMTIGELESVLAYVRRNYPLHRSAVVVAVEGVSKQRGNGQRPPTKGTVWTEPIHVPTYYPPGAVPWKTIIKRRGQ